MECINNQISVLPFKISVLPNILYTVSLLQCDVSFDLTTLNYVQLQLHSELKYQVSTRYNTNLPNMPLNTKVPYTNELSDGCLPTWLPDLNLPFVAPLCAVRKIASCQGRFLLERWYNETHFRPLKAYLDLCVAVNSGISLSDVCTRGSACFYQGIGLSPKFGTTVYFVCLLCRIES